MDSSWSATYRVEKATSDLLSGPDWTMNIEICDSINSNHWVKEVFRAVKRRLQHKSPQVQLLALTLLEAMVKNCNESVHFHITERRILPEMVKIVRKKTDMRVKDKTLILLDSWQEAFGGAGGNYPQYYEAYADLRQTGVKFPWRESDPAPIFTPPASRPSMGHSHAVYGLPNNHTRVDAPNPSETETLSLASLDSTMNVMELLRDMLQSVDPSDSLALEDDVIDALVSRCRSNQEKLVEMLKSTGDEALLCYGLELNDKLQSLLARHDAVASGLHILIQATSFSPHPTVVASTLQQNENSLSGPGTNMIPSAPFEEEEEDDEFAQLFQRRSNQKPISSQVTPARANATEFHDLPVPITTREVQETFDLLGITMSTPTSPSTPGSFTTTHELRGDGGYLNALQPYLENEWQAPCNSNAVPWAPPQYTETSSSYPPPPWESPPSPPTTGTSSLQFDITGSYVPMQRPGTLQSHNSFPATSSNVAPSTGQKPFIPSYKLFEDLDVFGNTADGRVNNVRNNASPNLSGI